MIKGFFWLIAKTSAPGLESGQFAMPYPWRIQVPTLSC